MEEYSDEGSDGNESHGNNQQGPNLGACSSALAKVRNALLDAVGGGGDGGVVKASLLLEHSGQGGQVPGQHSCLYLLKSFRALHRPNQASDCGVVQLQALKDGGKHCLWIASLFTRETK